MEIRPLLAAMTAAALALPAHAQDIDGEAIPMVAQGPGEPAPIGNTSDWVTNAVSETAQSGTAWTRARSNG